MLLVLLAEACAPPPRECITTPGPSEAWPELGDWLEATREEHGLVGLAAAVSGPEGLVWSGGAGVEDRMTREPIDPAATTFRWASVSKAITGVLAASLAEEGAADLHGDVADVYPAYEVPHTWLDGCTERACEAVIPDDRRHVSLHQLLTHTAGTMHYGNGQGLGEPPFLLTGTTLANTGMEWALPWWVDKPLVAVPGEVHSYSSYGYNLAGVVLEHAVGERFWEMVQARVVAPSGACSIQPDYPWAPVPRRATGYVQLEEYVGLDYVVENADGDVTWKLAAAGFVSTVEDLARYCDALVHERVLPRNVLDTTAWAPHVDDGAGAAYGYGFTVGERHGARRVSHTGSQPEGRAFVAGYPELGACFAVMTNSSWAPIGEIGRGLEDTWWGLAP